MPDIKIKQVIKGIIKALDRSRVLQDKAKGNLTKIKAAAENSVQVGTPVYACESGTVTHAGWKGGYGKYFIINHGNGL